MFIQEEKAVAMVMLSLHYLLQPSHWNLNKCRSNGQSCSHTQGDHNGETPPKPHPYCDIANSTLGHAKKISPSNFCWATNKKPAIETIPHWIPKMKSCKITRSGNKRPLTLHSQKLCKFFSVCSK